MTSRMLHAFDILPALDSEGRAIPLDLNAITSQLIAAPLPFPARFKVRNESMEQLLLKEFSENLFHGELESWWDKQ